MAPRELKPNASLLPATILAACSTAAAFAQTAQVTFYSGASILKTLVPLSGSAFAGYIFDGDKELAILQYKRYLTFDLPAGEHLFSAGFSKKHPPKERVLTVNLRGGGQYFIAASTDYKHYVVLDTMHGVLTETGCQEAQALAGKLKLEEIKKVNPEQRPLAQPLAEFPTCKP